MDLPFALSFLIAVLEISKGKTKRRCTRSFFEGSLATLGMTGEELGMTG
jgi:hypothetical protein